MRHAIAAGLAAIALSMAPGAAPAEAETLTVELNKLEDGEGGVCRAFFLFRNETGTTFAGFEMSLAVLDGGGVIDQLLSVDAAPLPVARTTLKLFEIPGIACGDISEVLLHDMPQCRPENADDLDCFTLMTLVSRAAARFDQ